MKTLNKAGTERASKTLAGETLLPMGIQFDSNFPGLKLFF